MKRNKKTRCAAMLFTLCLVTTSIVGGTFAKYTTTGEASDTARVAKFGVVIATSGSLFSDAYVEEQGDNIPTAWNGKYVTDDKEAITVSTNKENKKNNIVAPGTQSDSGLTFGISGTPEVSTKIEATIEARDIFLRAGYTYAVLSKTEVVTAENISKLAGNKNNTTLYATDDDETFVKVIKSEVDNYIDDGVLDSSYTFYQLSNETTVNKDYYPVVYSLEGGTSYDGTVESPSTKGVAKALLSKILDDDCEIEEDIEEIDDMDEDYEFTTYTVSDDDSNVRIWNPNTVLDGIDNKSPQLGSETLTWVWDFDSEGVGTYDTYDTILGDMIKWSIDRDDNYIVVAKETGGDDYDIVTYSDTNLALLNDSDVIASLETSFDITLTVTQVD